MPTDTTAQEAQKLIDFAVARLGRVEGNGQCWTLVNNGFQSLGFHKPSATYSWGRTIAQLSNARPGDVFQFTRFTVRVENEDGSWTEETRGEPRHTAILESIDANGYATFLESNVYNDRSVQRRSYYVKTADLEGGTTVRISGSFVIQRPQMP
ncbi:CHAP domain-containing protein [Rhodobacterales bacterium]|nr:CHAP domain-containing protein [Rhodobacterales bacterium]